MTLYAAILAMTLARFEIRDPDSGIVLAQVSEQVQQVGAITRRTTSYTTTADRRVHTETYDTGDAGRLEAYAFASPSGERVEVKRDASGALALAYRERANDATRETRLGATDATLMGKAVPELILKRWDELASGETVRFDLVVPSRLETITFRLRADASRSRPGERLVVVTEADSWIVRQFAPDLTFTFTEGSRGRRLTELVGPSPIELAGRRHKTVRLVPVDL